MKLFKKEKIFEKEFLPRISNEGILVTYVGCNKDYDNWSWWDSTKLDLDRAHAEAYRGCVDNQMEKYKLTGCHLFSIDDVIVWGKDDAFVKKIEKDVAFTNFVARLQLRRGITFSNYVAQKVAQSAYLFPSALFTEGAGDILLKKIQLLFKI